MSIPGIGELTALTWVLETGDVIAIQFHLAKPSATVDYAADSRNQQERNNAVPSPKSGTNTSRPN